MGLAFAFAQVSARSNTVHLGQPLPDTLARLMVLAGSVRARAELHPASDDTFIGALAQAVSSKEQRKEAGETRTNSDDGALTSYERSRAQARHGRGR